MTLNISYIAVPVLSYIITLFLTEEVTFKSIFHIDLYYWSVAFGKWDNEQSVPA